MMTDHFYTKDHPEANYRVPQPGERAYSFTFPLSNGNEIVVHCGDESMGKFREFLGSMDLDDAADTASKAE